jgi:branched-chain amino acid transport system ATP-binding protein
MAFLVFAPRGAGQLAPSRLRARRRSRATQAHVRLELADGEVVGLQDVHLRYGAGEEALRGVSLRLVPGKVHAVLGQNGAGKTTLLQVVAGFPPGVVAHQSGAVCFRAPGEQKVQRLAAEDAPGVRVGMGIALVPAEDKVFRGLTVRQQLEEAVSTGRSRLGERALRVEDLLERFPQLEGRLAAPGYQLSGGERQQLALACALARAPKVLVIDEATLGLSPANGVRMCDSIRELAAASGVAVLLAEQNAAIAERVADEITVLRRGAAIFQGGQGEALARSLREAYLAAPNDLEHADAEAVTSR